MVEKIDCLEGVQSNSTPPNMGQVSKPTVGYQEGCCKIGER